MIRDAGEAIRPGDYMAIQDILSTPLDADGQPLLELTVLLVPRGAVCHDLSPARLRWAIDLGAVVKLGFAIKDDGAA